MAQAAAVTWYTGTGTICDGYNNSGEGYTPAAQAGTFYIFNTDEDGAKHLFVTETYSTLVNTAKDTSLQQSLTAVSIVNKGETSTFDGSGWYTQAVPEPTSGLLLLLGVAGLALRRRRA